MTDSPTSLARLLDVQQRLNARLIGHDVLVERLLIALLTRGHLLLEGPPGLAKTRSVNEFAAAIDASFVRIQATPDLLPADLTGTELFHQASGEFRFRQGPLFHQIVLMDEINRAPPKVQSALLEAMGEGQITTGGQTRMLDDPFLVAATQNPIEHEGTYPLPEAQLDRFMFFLDLQLPDQHRERQILDYVLSEHTQPQDAHTAATPSTVTVADVRTAQDEVSRIHLSDAVRDYIVRLVVATRDRSDDVSARIVQAASPRGSIFLAQAAQAKAWLAGRDFSTPDDVAALAVDVLSGRIALDYRARAEGHSNRSVLTALVETISRV